MGRAFAPSVEGWWFPGWVNSKTEKLAPLDCIYHLRPRAEVVGPVSA